MQCINICKIIKQYGLWGIQQLRGLIKTTYPARVDNCGHFHYTVLIIFTEGEGDGIESRLPFKIFPTLSTIHVTKCGLSTGPTHLFLST